MSLSYRGHAFCILYIKQGSNQLQTSINIYIITEIMYFDYFGPHVFAFMHDFYIFNFISLKKLINKHYIYALIIVRKCLEQNCLRT